MGVFNDAVEAEVQGRHISLRGVVTFYGGRVGLYVDGRKYDSARVFMFSRRVLMTELPEGLVYAEVSLGLFGTRYRLFVDDVEVPLHVETGESSWSIELAPPRFLSQRAVRALKP